MSKQKFDSIEREAIYYAYNEKCVYSSKSLDPNNFDIDHIIPESLAEKENEDELKNLLEICNLPMDFDIFSYKNLLPCKPHLNKKKSKDKFNPATINFYLSIASKKELTIINNIERIRKSRKRGLMMLRVNSLLQEGIITRDELHEYMMDVSSRDSAKTKILKSLEFYDYEPTDSISKNDIEILKKKHVKVGGGSYYHELVLTNENDGSDKVVVKTCEEYESALKNGYYAQSQYDIKMESWFIHQCGLLNALSNAILPTKSYMSDPRVSILDLSRLPYKMFPELTGDNRESNLSYQDKINNGEMVVKKIASNFLNIECQYMGQVLIEIFRMDLNGDGIEDVFLYEYMYATEGTFGAANVIVLSILNDGDMFTDITKQCNI